jgi:cyclohexyl-isocyanide hydratase
MSDIDRRHFGEGLAAFAALLAGARPAASAPREAAAPSSSHDMSAMPAHWMGKERIAFLIYPGFTALDMVGPQYMLANLMGAKVDTVARTREPVRSDTGLVFTPSARFEDATDIDILCVPGGSAGTLAAMRDEETLAYLRAAARKASHVTSVCTGSMLLGSAGLLEGYRATSHWVTKPLLPIFGAIPADGRVVQDRDRITAEGVTAGLDFSLALVGQLRDRTYAEGVQLLAQYAPEPPYSAGEPETAPRAVTTMIESMFTRLTQDMEAAGKVAFAKAKAL